MGLRLGTPCVFHGHEDDQQVVSEVVDVLDMWSFIESAYVSLSKNDKALVAKEAKPFGEHVEFRGFDGNYESECIGVSRFLIEKLDRFTGFNGRDLNSHVPSVERYRITYNVFEPIRRTLVGRELSATDLIAILKESTHPDHRES